MSAIRYLRIKTPDTEEIRVMVKAFCEEIEYEYADSLMHRTINGDIKVFGALNGRLVGIVGCCRIGEIAHGGLLYVLPAYRNGRVAGLLYQTALKQAKEEGCKKVSIVVAAVREKLYRKIGYDRKFAILEKEI